MWRHPWVWISVGLAANTVAFIWARCAGEGRVPLDVVQVSLAVFGVLASGIGLWMRCALPRTASLNDLSTVGRRRALFLLMSVQILLIVGVCIWAVFKLSTHTGNMATLPGDVVGVIILLLLVAPWGLFSTHHMWHRAGDVIPLSEHFETALLTTQAGISALIGSWALYWGPESPEEWDSLRLFLAVVGGVAFLSAPIVAASRPVRRFAVSCIIVLHFAGILCAVMGTPPGPWILMQTHHWVFRPYLDFMYLNNAYRFYSPEPGPASQLWLRIEYDDGTYHWTKVPDMNDKGQHRYSMSLQYTRRLALTENVARTGLIPPMMVPNANGEMDLAPYAKMRVAHSPLPPAKIGELRVKDSLEIPMHPDLQINFQPPTPDGQRLLASYSRHILRQPNPGKPNAKPLFVKIYRVQHRILPAEVFASGADPRDWVFYLPYYMGRFDTTGKLTDPNDPFLYWLVPIMRERMDDPRSHLRYFVFKHAGDPPSEWVRPTPPSWAR